MANEVNANIRIDLDTSDALASLRDLQAQISAFNRSVVQSNATAVAAQKSMLSTLTAQIGATQQFTTSMTNVETSVSRLGRSIDKNKLSLGEYFRYGVASSRNFSRVFGREHNEILDLARDRVQRLQTQYIALGEAQNGVTRAMAVRPMNIFNSDAAIAVQRQQLFNKLLHDGSTSLINFGKNTQWAGRQLMVGFSVPMTIFGGMAGKIFMDLEKEVVNFRRVYGDATTPLEETNGMIMQIQQLGREFTKYGIAVSDTVALAADAAAAGAQSENLIAATAQATRLSTLGMIDQQQALTATIALQSAFGLSADKLAESVNFLNAVENQTVVSLADITEAIPKVAPVIQGLGGDVQDLAVFMAALREGGVSAGEGANALKSGLASLISPTKNAREQLQKVGIDIDAILSANKGDIQATVRAFGEALMTLDKFERQQTLATVFGKYQFARLGALFENIARDGSQAQRVVDLTAMSVAELGQLADKELSAIEDSVGTKFTAALEKFRLAIAPIGEAFLRVATPIIEGATKIFEKFNELSPEVKNFAVVLAAALGVVIPTVIMLIGLFANFAGNAIKGVALMNNFFNKIRGGGDSLNYLSQEELDAAAAASSLEGKTTSLTTAINVQRSAVQQLTRAYGKYIAAAQAGAANLPQGFGRPPRRMATGGMVGGSGNKDNQPALLTPGEFVMNRNATEKFGPVLDAMNRGTVKGFQDGSRLATTSFGTFATPSQSSARAIEGYLSTLVDLSEQQRVAVVEELQRLERQQSLTKQNLEQALKQVGIGIRSLPQSMVDAHVFPQSRTSITGAEAIRLAEASGSPITAASSIQKLSVLDLLEQSVPGSTRILARSDFVAALPAAINEGLKRGISATDFTDAFETSGIQKWGKVIKMSGANAEDAIPEFSLLDRKIVELARSSGMLIGDFDDAERGIVSFGTITRQAVGELEDAGHRMTIVRSAIDDLDGRFRTFQVGINADLIPALRSAGYTIQEVSRQSTSGRIERGYEVSGPGISTPTFFRGQSQRERAPGAYGNVSALDLSRFEQQQAEEVGTKTGQATIRGLKTGTQSHSESRAARRVANDTVDGFVNQIDRRVDESNEAAQRLGQAATEGLTSSTSDIRQILKDRLNLGPIVEKEKVELQELTRLRQAENREIEKRMMLLQRQGASPFGLRERAIADIEKERAAAAAPPPVVPAGAQLLPVVAPDIEKNTADLSDETKNTTKEMSKTRKAMNKVGDAFVNGSAKMQGAFFALDGIAFGASLMDNAIGDFAQKIMPAIFAIQGLTMVLPLLTNPIGLAALAAGALVVGIWALNKKQEEARKRTVEYSIAMQGSAKAFTELSKAFGGQKPSEIFAQMAGGSQNEKQIETFTKAQEFIKSEAGQGMMQRFQMTSGQERVNAIVTELTQSIGMGIIDSETAHGVAQAIAVELKSPMLGYALVSGISDYVRKTRGQTSAIVQDLTQSISKDLDNVLNKYEQTFSQEARLRSLALKVSSGAYTPEEYQEYIDLSNEAQSAQDNFATSSVSARQAIGPLLNVSQKLAEAQALINTKYREGALTVDEYKRQVDLLEEQNQRVRDSINQLLIDLPDYGQFMESLEMSALALGIPQEKVDQIKTQVENISGILENEYGVMEGQAENAAKAIAAALVSGTLDPGVAGSLTTLLADKQWNQVINVALEGDITELPTVLNMINTLDQIPEPLQKEILVKLGIQGPDGRVAGRVAADQAKRSLADLSEEYSKLTVLSSYFASNSRLGAEALAAGLDGIFNTEQLSNAEKLFNTLNSSEQVSTVFDFSNVDLNSLVKIDKVWTDLGKKKDIRATLKADDNFSQAMNDFKVSYDQINSLPDIMKQAILLKLEVQAQLDLQVDQALDAAIPSGGQISGAALAQSAGLDEIRNLIESVSQGGFDQKQPESTGGGSPTKSWLEQLLIDIKADLALFVGNLEKGVKPLVDKLRGLKIPEQIIDAIGTGEEGKKRAQELLAMNAEERQRFINRQNKRTVGKFIRGPGGLDTQVTQKQNKETVKKRLEDRGVEKSIIDKILSSEEAINAVLVANNNELSQIVEKYGKLQTSQEIIDAKVKEIKDAHEETIKIIDKEIDARQEIVNAIQAEIDELQKKNDADQWSIRNKEREKELIDRQIEVLERANEMDQRRIETLQRQDELRNREADALSYELSAMSDLENKIRETYQKRIEALDKVAEVNSHILDQQRQQLGLSQALSQGDIYAATAAVQQMRQSDAQFAQQQMRAGLQQGMENAVSGLTTSGGLTRDQAEERIKQIKEQSYQTSLLIRDIEDKIYERNQLMIPLKDQQYQIDLQIRDISDQIFARETQIHDIQKNRLEPAQAILDNLNKQKTDMQLITDEAISQIEALGDTSLGIDAVTKKTNSLADAWFEVSKQIDAANKLARQERASLVAPVRAVGESDEEFAKRVKEWEQKKADIEAKRKKSVEDALTSGRSAMGMFGGGSVKKYGMGKKVNGYAMGSVVGAGSRDSVSAMLTPGEFVVRKAMVNKYGVPMLSAINQGSFAMPRYSSGVSTSGSSSVRSGASANIVAPMYNNYSVSVNVSGTTASADEIANRTIMKIKQMQNMQIRSGRGY